MLGSTKAAGRAARGLLILLIAVAAWLAPQAAFAQQINGHFTLTTHEGRRLSDADLRGRPYAVFFGFTHCPEVCPTALYELSLVLGELGPDADRVKVLFVTVDPARDTQEQLATFVGAFDPRIVALRGTEEETIAAARAFKATYRRVPQDNGDYTMDHTALVFLMDRNGAFFDKVDYREDHATQVAKFRRLIAAE